MAIKIQGNTIIDDTRNAIDVANLNYTGTLTGGTGVVNLGSGQVVKDASGDVGIGTASPSAKLDIVGAIYSTTYQETVGTISGSTLDLSTGNVFFSAPSSSPTYVFSNPPASGKAFGFILRIAPSATVAITWPASVKWPDGIAPDAPASGETSIYVFYTQDGGTTYFGFVSGEDMA